MEKISSRVVVSLILSFLQSFFMFGAIATAIVYVAFLSQWGFQVNIANSGYYAGLSHHISTEMENRILPTGLPLEVLEDVVDEYMVRRDLERYVEARFNRTQVTLSEEIIRTRLSQNISRFLDSVDEEVSPETVGEIIEHMLGIYRDSLQFPFVDQLALLRYTLRIGVVGVAVGSLICGLFTGTLINKIQNWQHRAYRYWSYILGGTGLMLVAIPLWLWAEAPHRQLAIRPLFVFDFMVSYIEQGLELFKISGGVLLLAAVGLGVLSITSVPEMKRMKKRW